MTLKCPICNNDVEEGSPSCVHCGFRFLGSTQSFTPIKLDESGMTTAPSGKQVRELRVVRGPQTGIEIAIRDGVMTVGRDPRCDIFLNDMTVSRDHATIETSTKGCVITDRNSFNGVWVNDRSVDVCLLKTGDIIQIGSFCLVYKEQG